MKHYYINSLMAIAVSRVWAPVVRCDNQSPHFAGFDVNRQNDMEP